MGVAVRSWSSRAAWLYVVGAGLCVVGALVVRSSGDGRWWWYVIFLLAFVGLLAAAVSVPWRVSADHDGLTVQTPLLRRRVGWSDLASARAGRPGLGGSVRSIRRADGSTVVLPGQFPVALVEQWRAELEGPVTG